MAEPIVNDIDVQGVRAALKGIREWGKGLANAAVIADVVINEKVIVKKLRSEASSLGAMIARSKEALERKEKEYASVVESFLAERGDLERKLEEARERNSKILKSAATECAMLVKGAREDAQRVVSECKDKITEAHGLKKTAEDACQWALDQKKKAEDGYRRYIRKLAPAEDD